MRKLVILFISVMVLPMFFISCEEEDKPVVVPDPVVVDTTVRVVLTEEERANIATNKWIWEEMDVYYLWTNAMPEYEKSKDNPHDYFSSLLYSRDKWSYLAEDYKTWTDNLQGISKSMGYSLALYWKDEAQTSIIAVVEFVYPNTPAADAGIKRGDIIGKINGTDMVLDNYTNLLFDSEHSEIKLGEYVDDSFVLADTTISVYAEDIIENPVLHYEIIRQDDKTIGYLVYVGFISNFNDDLNEALSYFKSNNIDELVLDLRYNPGGDLGAANELCSSIAPTAVVDNQEVLVKYNWNTELQNYITSQAASNPEEWNDNLRILFDNTVKNKLNLSKLYALTTGGSASASELTLIGLDPYMEVIKIGETTHGKYAASITIPDEDSLWAIQPIVLKYSNSEGVTDFANGFPPDYPVEDVLAFGFGDLNDPMLKKAVELIIGRSLSESKSASMINHFGKQIASGGRHQAIQDGILNIDTDLLKR